MTQPSRTVGADPDVHDRAAPAPETTPEDNGVAGPEAAVVAPLTDVLVRTLRALGDAGRPVLASRLAARAWWLLREEFSRHAEHVNGTMHYLARLPPEPAADDRADGNDTPGSSEERKDLT